MKLPDLVEAGPDRKVTSWPVKTGQLCQEVFMDIYKLAHDFLLSDSIIKDWPEMKAILEQAVSGASKVWRLPIAACQAVGGEKTLAVPAVAAIACLQISIILIDDMLDCDPRGEYHRIGEAATANLAAAFYAAGLGAIVHSETQSTPTLAALESLNHMMLTTCLGQYLDVQNPENEDAYWTLVRTKSSPFFGAALHVGALLGGASPEIAAQVKKVGLVYGEMVQIHDDLNDTMEVPANPDWTLGRSPLPILFAQNVDHRDRSRFIELCEAIPDPGALDEAQNILIRCGAVSFAVDQLLRRNQTAQEMITGTRLANSEALEGVLADLVDPIRDLFEAIGIEESEALLRPTTLTR
ncbi:polyprenyl synthetase family protein [Chloroflexota bacterium]